MKVTLNSNFGTLGHMVELISNAHIKIGVENHGQYIGRFYAEVAVPVGPNTSITEKIRSYMSPNNSLVCVSMALPFMPTKPALEAFFEFRKLVEKILMEFVETETLPNQ
jgi:hypothetical protein